MKIGSLFSGVAGLDEAVSRVFDGEVVWFAENDRAASLVLAARFPDIPNHGDVTKIDWLKVEPVDILCGGFPCIDVSAAGMKKGLSQGTRSGLWSHFATAIDVLRPPIVIVENVRGLLSARANRSVELEDANLGKTLRAAGAVLGDLSDLGYDAKWQTVPAAAVGAPHKRERVFLIAYPPGQ